MLRVARYFEGSGDVLQRAVLPLVVGVMVTHAGLLAWSAYRHSPTITEVAYLAAGVSHWKLGRFDLARVGPPLVRLIGALPVLAAKPRVDWCGYSGAAGAREEFLVGRAFVEANGARSFWLFTIARWACIPFSLVGGVCCYLWSRDLYGHAAGLLAVALWCFSPSILGHGALMLSDAPAASVAVLATYTFRRWLVRPTWARAMVAGCALGAAQATKTSLLVLYPVWLLAWILSRSRRAPPAGETRAVLPLRQLALGGICSLYTLNFVYGFGGFCTALGEYRFVSWKNQEQDIQ